MSTLRIKSNQSANNAIEYNNNKQKYRFFFYAEGQSKCYDFFLCNAQLDRFIVVYCEKSRTK